MSATGLPVLPSVATRSVSKETLTSSSANLIVLRQHVDDLCLVTIGLSRRDVGGNDRVGAGLGPCPIPVVHKPLHGSIAPIVIVVTAAGGAIVLVADFVPDMRHTLRHRWKPGEQRFLSFSAKIEMARLW